MKTQFILLLLIFLINGFRGDAALSAMPELIHAAKEVHSSYNSDFGWQDQSSWSDLAVLSDSCPVIHYNGGINGTVYTEAMESVCSPVFSYFYGCVDGDGINSVVLYDSLGNAIMSHLNTNCNGDINGYNNFLPVQGITSCTLIRGESYLGYVSHFTNFYAENFGVWIDFDNDGIFSDSEAIAGNFGGPLPGIIQLDFSFIVPSDNLLHGWRKMRAISVFYTILTPNSSCIDAFFGETHDYYIYIAPSEAYYSCGVLDDYLPFYDATDDNDPAPILSQSPPAGTTISDDTIVTITATDFDGNTSAREILVNFADVSAPQMTCLSNVTYTIPENECTIAIDLNAEIFPVVSDNCGVDSTWHNVGNAIFTEGVYDVIWTSVDYADNLSTCSTQIEIIDTSPTSLICPENTTYYIPYNMDAGFVEVASPEVLNSCSDLTVLNNYNNSDNASDVYPLGTTTVEYQLINAGNTAITCQTQVSLIQCCQGDLNCDMTIDVNDLITLLQSFGCVNNCPVDVYPDGMIDLMDIQVMLSLVGMDCNN